MSLSDFVPFVIVPDIYKNDKKRKLSFSANLPYGTKIGGHDASCLHVRFACPSLMLVPPLKLWRHAGGPQREVRKSFAISFAEATAIAKGYGHQRKERM